MRNALPRLAALALALLAPGAKAASLQAMIDAAADNATVRPPAGTYHEHIVIRHPVELDGSGSVVIDGDGTGTVLTIQTDGVTVKSLTVQHSGQLHTQIDAGIRIQGKFNVVKDVTIAHSLFGIDLHQADNNMLKRNSITSEGNDDIGLKGDSIRLWYSSFNEIADNDIHDARDFVVWYSHDNKVIGNRIRNGRYGVHFMYAHNNEMRDNEVADCVVGVFLMYSNDLKVTHNRFLRSWGASGMGVGFKESSGVTVADNDIIGNAQGIYLDISPFDPDNPNTFTGNRIAYNGIGVLFHADWEGNTFAGNAFASNFTQIAVDSGGSALRETWSGNYWDDYSGFDRDGNGHGDDPYEIYNYADRLWMDLPSASFFRGAPALELVDFVERLAPFSEPKLLLKEPHPLMEPPPAAPAAAPAKSALELLQQ